MSLFVLLALLYVISSSCAVEARIGLLDHFHKPKSLFRRNVASPKDDDLLEPYQGLTPLITTTSSSVEEVGNGELIRIECSSTTKTNPITTTSSLSELAKNFEDALVAINKSNGDIHVGKLLSACERLGDTMNRIGFSQSAKDIEGNVRKIKSVYDRLPKSERDSMPAIVKYEINNGVHGGSPGSIKSLKENSATMGFLWLGRSINYQHDMFSNMVDRNEEPYEAAKRAYERALKPHLSWPLQKMGQAAMTSLKPMRKESMFSKIGGFPEGCYGQQEEQVIRNDLRHVMSTWKPMLQRWKEIFSELELGEI